MRRRPLAALFAALCLLVVGSTGNATSDGAIVVCNASIVDIERNRLVPRREVVIVGDRIVGIQAGGTARTPRNDRVLDGTGRAT